MSMKVVIIGGSTAGVAAGLRLSQAGHEVSIYERRCGGDSGGFGLLLTPSVQQGLRRLGLDVAGVGRDIDQFEIRDENDRPIVTRALQQTVGVKRDSLLELLRSSLDSRVFHDGKNFLGFESAGDGSATAALFEDGTRVEADLFIGADGIRSTVRQEWNRGPQLNPVKSVELVGTFHGELPEQLSTGALKFISNDDGLAIGIVPTSDNSAVWYIQCDPRRWPQSFSSVEERTRWIRQLAGQFPDPVSSIFAGSELENARLCRTTDRDLPENFHRGNVLLIGDAAHPLLTFTSQGTGSAIEDALAIGGLLDNNVGKGIDPDALSGILGEFSRVRKPILNARLYMGRRMQDQFLRDSSEQNQIMPLCS
ncbi:MAG TPA: FAD-dependent monooxygenase [Planctomycetes bacterium]|nr:FAD-dependent monooxygenase [Planctomycetota bacterium]